MLYAWYTTGVFVCFLVPFILLGVRQQGEVYLSHTSFPGFGWCKCKHSVWTRTDLHMRILYGEMLWTELKSHLGYYLLTLTSMALPDKKGGTWIGPVLIIHDSRTRRYLMSFAVVTVHSSCTWICQMRCMRKHRYSEHQALVLLPFVPFFPL